MDLFDSIPSSSLILTPNRRLASIIHKNFNTFQLQKNHLSWPTLDCYPLFPTWLEKLWKDYLCNEPNETRFVLNSHHEQIIWEKILREAPENEYLMQVTETAKLAKNAYETLKRWRVNLSDPTLKMTEDSRAFLRWAKQFDQLCHDKHKLNQPSLCDIIATKILEDAIPLPSHIVLLGFTELAPQYQHLFNLCKDKGTQVVFYKNPFRNIKTAKITLPNMESEIKTMACWAKSLMETSASIGCVIPNLEIQRDNVVRIFSDVFEEKSFNISAGKKLNSYPIIHSGLQILNLHKKNFSLSTLSSLLGSPFLGDAEREYSQRALFENQLKNLNVTRLSFNELFNSKEKNNLASFCPLLASRFKTFFTKIMSLEKKLSFSQWSTLFNELLTIMGWPGERSLNSHEYQIVVNSWLSLLNEFANLDYLLGEVNYSTALHYLTCMISNTIFQPESPESSVNILGLLEAADIPFDYVWVMGLDDTSWPPRAKPNPFIPFRLQKKLHMPNASAERELIYCKQLTQQLQASANHIIFSHAAQLDNMELHPSFLLNDFPVIHKEDLTLSPYTPSANHMFQAQQLEYLNDENAPPISETETVKGGVSIFKLQAECAFKAFAELRLHAKKTEEPELGLRKLDRGILTHKALELIWKELKDSMTLLSKTDAELRNLVHQAAETALADLTNIELAANPRYLLLEKKRLEKILLKWLEIEKNRPAFRVIAQEAEITTLIGKITARFRIDRIDVLLDHTETTQQQLIIDYKTAKDIKTSSWFGERLDEPQLPLYCIINPENTIGIAFGKINPHQMDMIGISKVPVKMNSIKLLAEVNQVDAALWDEQMQRWKIHLTQLSDDFYAGKASINPKKNHQTCDRCGLHSFCRIHELTTLEASHEED